MQPPTIVILQSIGGCFMLKKIVKYTSYYFLLFVFPKYN